MKTIYFLLSIFILSLAIVEAQHTVGTISLDQDQVSDGYSLLYPQNQSSTFLIDNCGQVINQWNFENDHRPGAVSYLTPEGKLLAASNNFNLYQSSYGAGGAGGVVEMYDWEGNLEWRYILADSIYRQHHDIHYMPNGNVLVLSWERHALSEVVANGFDTITNNQKGLWSDAVFEIDPNTSEIVWEWHSWDHIIQDYDVTKDNFGVVSDHSELIDINYQKFSFGREDWMHCNAIDYNERLDQILISARNFNEIWIVDHSTSSDEAATHEGGNANKGGDLLFRWGNPEAYQNGDDLDRKSFYQHDAKWADDYIDTDHPQYEHIVFYNNMIELDLSLGHAIDPTWDEVSKTYSKDSSNNYLPSNYSQEYSHPDTLKNYSTAASSIQLLANGHTLMCAGRQGRIFELNQEQEVVWEYLTPMKFGAPVSQGTVLSLSDNFTFQCEKYPLDYSGFEGRDLFPNGFIELDPMSICDLVSIEDHQKNEESVYPNPCWNKQLYFKNLFHESVKFYNANLELILEKTVCEKTSPIDLSDLQTGIYFIRFSNSQSVQKIIIP